MAPTAVIRFGTLGAARISPAAIVRPARDVPGVELVAVAARDRARAEKFAAKHAIPRVFDDYETLIADPDIDAIYNPLPNGLHAEWTERALRAGKHVLCEKPLTANTAEAERVAAVAAETGLVVMEAFHYRYHPVAETMREIAQSGELGELRRIESNMCIPLPMPKDIRYRYDLAGGAVMDVGCYAIHMNRLVAGREPTVVRARARLAKPNVDRWMQAELRYTNGLSGQMTCALWSSSLLKIGVKVTGDAGSLSVFNPTGPHMGYRITVRAADGSKRRVKVGGAKKPTYTYQLEAFAAAVLDGQPVLTPPADSIANMRVIDAIYEAAGLPARGDLMETKQLSAYLARGRVGLGLAAMVAPGPALTVMFGRSANTAGARAMGRLFGVRDGVLGAGGSIAIGQRSGGGDWLSMMAVCDAFDAVVMLVTPGLPKRARLIGVLAAKSAVAHLYLARQLAAEERATTPVL